MTVTCVMHPDTYLNKVLVGTAQGELQLWNLKTNKCVYRFKGWGSAVLSVVQSNVVDVVAIGLEDGRILMHNLKADRTLFKFVQSEGAVTTLAFRSDAGFQQLVSGSKSGTLAVWDLEKQQLITVLRNVHDGPVVKAHFFQGEPLLLTSGTDNALHIWIFDQTDGTARLLKSRSGHSQPPTKIHFCGTSSTILSGGQDRSFRFFSTIRDQRSRELSQGHIQAKANNVNYLGETGSATKLSPIIDFAFNITKQKQWDNVVSCHRGSSTAITWNRQNLIIGKYRLQSHSPSHSNLSSVAISACGNYALLGSQSGYIDKYNIQSGIHRGAFPDAKLLGKREANEMRHTSAVTGIVVDAVNCYAISGSLDGTIKFWNFNDGTLFKSINVGTSVTQLAIAKESSLLAAVSDDFVIHVFDIDTQVCVRRLHGHTALITDLTFTADGRWIVSSSGDSSVRVWDLPTGHCVDWVIMPSPVVSLTMSPRGDFLATTHVDSRGIFLWANQNYFTNLFLQPVTTPHPVQVSMPVVEGITDGDAIAEDDGDEDTDGEAKEEMDVDEQQELKEAQEKQAEEENDGDDDLGLYHELITLSKAPKSKWKTLVNLELINERNKPEKAPETPKAAPFFLPTLPGIKTKFLAAPEEEIELPDMKHIDMSRLKPTTPFIAALQKAVLSKKSNPKQPSSEASSFIDVANMLKDMSPSAIDFEMNSLSVENDFAEFALVFRFILDQFQRNINYEMAQALLNVMIKHQGEVISTAIAEDGQIKRLFEEIEVAQNASWERLQSLFHSNLCLVGYFSNLQQ